MNNWNPPTKDLIARLLAADLPICRVDDGGEEIRISYAKTNDEVIEQATAAITAVDTSTLYVSCQDGRTRWIEIVLGNTAAEMVSDYQPGSPEMETVIEEHSAAWEGWDAWAAA